MGALEAIWRACLLAAVLVGVASSEPLVEDYYTESGAAFVARMLSQAKAARDEVGQLEDMYGICSKEFFDPNAVRCLRGWERWDSRTMGVFCTYNALVYDRYYVSVKVKVFGGESEIRVLDEFPEIEIYETISFCTVAGGDGEDFVRWSFDPILPGGVDEEQWRTLVENYGDFESLGLRVKKNEPVPGLKEFLCEGSF